MDKLSKITHEDLILFKNALVIAKKCRLKCVITIDDYLRETDFGYFWTVPTIKNKYLSLVDLSKDLILKDKKELLNEALMIPYVYQKGNKLFGEKKKIGQKVSNQDFIKSYNDLIYLDEKYDIFYYTFEELLKL